MKRNATWLAVSVLLIFSFVLTACATPATEVPTQAATEEMPAPEEFIFGVLLVGPYNDRGWSEAHYNAGLYVEQKVPGTKMLYVDKVNTADRPGTTPDQLAEDLLAKGAKVMLFTSDDMKDGALEFAKKHPDIPVIHYSGDYAWQEGKNYQGVANLANYMPQMEYGEMIGGCAAALTTQTGNLGYVGPLINDETRRFANALYLGAKYCWTNMLSKDPEDLSMKVTWIGFWFNIPGVTADPTQVSDEFLNSGYDVLVSALDTTEALVQAEAAVASGKQAWAVAYDYEKACDEAPEICLGVRYFNWGPAYARAIKSVQDGTFKAEWVYEAPNWSDLNNPDTSPIGFFKGEGLSAENAALVDQFIAELAGGLNLWTGPLNWQDGTPFLAAGETATEAQIWYQPQLLEGIEGQSATE